MFLARKVEIMRKDINMDFVKCHSCDEMIDVSKQALIFNEINAAQ